jgi:F0F1-type ATP synthase membrane subunit c/vacuolar-type H+-ATPase subunit K
MRRKHWPYDAAALVTLATWCVLGLSIARAQEGTPPAGAPQQPAAAQQPGADRGIVAISIATAVGLACLGAGYAVARVGSAALGAASENPELLTRSLIFVGLAEGIAIYGLLIAILLWIKL